eukprot:2116257-Pleurochrysis_carterae.AAC.1
MEEAPANLPMFGFEIISERAASCLTSGHELYDRPRHRTAVLFSSKNSVAGLAIWLEREQILPRASSMEAPPQNYKQHCNEVQSWNEEAREKREQHQRMLITWHPKVVLKSASMAKRSVQRGSSNRLLLAAQSYAGSDQTTALRRATGSTAPP